MPSARLILIALLCQLLLAAGVGAQEPDTQLEAVIKRAKDEAAARLRQFQQAVGYGAEPLVTLEAIKKLTAAEAAEGRAVKVRGVFAGPVFLDNHGLLLQGEEAIQCGFPDASQVPPANAEVEVTGVTRPAPARVLEETAAIEAQSVRIVAQDAGLPPHRVPLETLNARQHLDRWVETEGVVMQMQLRANGLFVSLAGETQYLHLVFRPYTARTLPSEWLRSRVRFRGIGVGPGHETGMVVCGMHNVTVVARGPDDYFAAPEAKAADLLRGAVARPEQARFTATLLRMESHHRLWLRADDGTPFLSHIHGRSWPPHPQAPQFTSSIPPIPPMHPGDVVELAGSPHSDGASLLMRYCHMRVMSSDGDASPRPADAPAVARGGRMNDLVTVTGRLAGQSAVMLQPGQQYETARLLSGGAELEIYCQSPQGGNLPRLSADDLIEATGFVVPGATPGTGQLMLRGPSDIRSLGIAPEVTRARQWRIVGTSAGVVLLAGVVILALRRRLVKERALAGEVRLLNATLEHRVQERTAELEKAREDLKDALNEEREVGELKSRFVSTVSHEFRTPLGVIMSAADILESYMDRLTPERKQEHLSEIRNATRHMSGMMEDVLLLGRAESGRLHLTPRPCDLLDLCQRIANEAHSATSQTGTTTITSDPLPGPALVDEMLLRHMLSNLLSNAIKYSPPGAEVKFHIAHTGPDAILTITDCGIGIPPEDAPKLFEPFARATNVGQRTGTGLGLVVVKRCAELHGGSVSFSSVPGEGTTFTLRLPVFAGPASLDSQLSTLNSL